MIDLKQYFIDNHDKIGIIDNKRECIYIKNSTNQGFLIGKIGDGVDLQFLHSVRRGRVQSKMSSTLSTQINIGVIVDRNAR